MTSTEQPPPTNKQELRLMGMISGKFHMQLSIEKTV